MKFNLFIFVFFLSNISFSQIDNRFIQHLQKHKLYKEQLYYLNTIDHQITTKDSIAYQFSKFYLQQQQDSLFFVNYELSKQLFNSDSTALRSANYHFLKHTNSYYQNRWFSDKNKIYTDTINTSLTNLYISLSSKQNTTYCINPELTKEIHKYNKLKHKSPAFAGMLSAIVPGLGKFYGQRPRSGVNTIISNGINAYQAIESINKYGIKNGFSIFSVSFFGLFYLSNIYGSYHDLKDLKKQKKKQILIDAEKYYHINYPVSLYK